MGPGNRKVCSKCGRRRSKHPKPFGKNCELDPLDQEQKDAVLAEIAAEAEHKEDSETEEDITDTEPENPTSEELAKMKADLEAQREQAQKEIKAQEEKLAKKQQDQELIKEIQELRAALDKDRERLVNLAAKIEEPNVIFPKVKSKKTVKFEENVTSDEEDESEDEVIPVRRKSKKRACASKLCVGCEKDRQPVRCTRCPEELQPARCQRYCREHDHDRDRRALSDPAVAAYVEACEEPVPGNPVGVGARRKESRACDIHEVINRNPLLAAACGDTTRKEQTDGKSMPEQFAYKDGVTSTAERISFYDFMHGAFRLLNLRLNYDHKPIDDRIVYFENLALCATTYKWSACYKLHCALMEQIQGGTRKWDDSIPSLLSHKYLNADEFIRERGSGEKKPPKEHKGNNQKSEGGNSREKESGTCDDFNEKEYGCNFGNKCRFHHECSECKKKGIRASHPAMYCKIITGSNK